MRVLYATAELDPVAVAGGLAAVAAGLSAELRRQGVVVDVVVPDYGGAELAGERRQALDVPRWAGPATVRVGDHAAAGRVHLVRSAGIARPHPYLRPDGSGWSDNSARFLAFSQAVAALVRADPPDVLHVNDWHPGAALAALGPAPPAVLSIHDLAHQGVTDGRWLDYLGPRARHYEWWGRTNPLSGAIALADRVVAASPRYAREIRTPAGGCGLDGPLRDRGDAVVGIRYGIDTGAWDPATDGHLAATYSAGNGRAALAAKAANRRVVLDRVGWPDDGAPLAVMVTRLATSTGVDLLEPIVPVLGHIPLRLVVLGVGDGALAARLAAAAADHPGSFAFVEAYDEPLAHLLLAAGDLYVMPSRVEPCGSMQMKAMRYGAIPVVTGVGGLRDSVTDADVSADGTGFVADRVDAVAVVSALFRAVRRMSDRRRRPPLVRRAMARDWSWRDPAAAHVDLYRDLLGAGDAGGEEDRRPGSVCSFGGDGR